MPWREIRLYESSYQKVLQKIERKKIMEHYKY